MKEVTEKSIIPVYLVGLSWLIYSLVFPLHDFRHYLIATALSAAVYFASSALIPKKTVYVTMKTGIAQVDELVSAFLAHTAELEKIAALITNEDITATITKITAAGGKMSAMAAKKPDLAGRLVPFADYYFPTLLKLLNAYTELSENLNAGGNVAASRDKIEGVLGTISAAFTNALNNMYADTALDITAEIDALNNIIVSEGLAAPVSAFGTVSENTLEESAAPASASETVTENSLRSDVP